MSRRNDNSLRAAWDKYTGRQPNDGLDQEHGREEYEHCSHRHRVETSPCESCSRSLSKGGLSGMRSFMPGNEC